jgi:hypothetical protein
MQYAVEKSVRFHISSKGVGIYRDPAFSGPYDGGWFEVADNDMVLSTEVYNFKNANELLDFMDEELQEGIISEEEEENGDFRNIPRLLYSARSGIESMDIKNVTYLGYRYTRHRIEELK